MFIPQGPIRKQLVYSKRHLVGGGARAQGFLSDGLSRVVVLPLPPVGSGTEPGQKPRRRVVWRERTHVGGKAAGP